MTKEIGPTIQHDTSAAADEAARLTVRLTDDGRVDLEALEVVVEPGPLRDWVTARLKQRDPYVSLDDDSMEPPEQLFVDLWRRSPPSSRFREALEVVCTELVRDAQHAETAAWVEPLLRLVTMIRPMRAQHLLTRVVQHTAFSKEVIAANLDRRWLEAAAAYEAQPAELITIWDQLLTQDRYRAIAYRAMLNDCEQGIWYLPQYYKALNERERPLLLREALRKLLARGTTMTLERLRWRADRMNEVPGLPAAIDVQLRMLGQPSLFEGPGAVTPEPISITTTYVPKHKLQNMALARTPKRATQ